MRRKAASIYTPAERRMLVILKVIHCTPLELATGLRLSIGTVHQHLNHLLTDGVITCRYTSVDRRRRVYAASEDV